MTRPWEGWGEEFQAEVGGSPGESQLTQIL